MATPADNARFNNPRSGVVNKPNVTQAVPPSGDLQTAIELLNRAVSSRDPSASQYAAQYVAGLPIEAQRQIFEGQVKIPVLYNGLKEQSPALADELYLKNVRENLGRVVQAYRTDQFMQGRILPGVDETGYGTSLSPQDRANNLAAKNINRGEDILTALSEDPGAYIWNPYLDQGAGYQVTDRLKMMGEADPLQLEYQREAIDQRRSNTTGRDAQGRSISDLDQIIQEGGLTAIDRARMARSNEMRGAAARGAEQAIMADAEEQGRGGGAQSTMARLMARQNQARMMASDDLETQAMALGRRDQAIGQRAAIGGQVQTAQDVIDNFNAMGRRDMEASRVNAINQGREATWNENNRRNAVDTGTYNAGVNMQYTDDSGRSARNTNTLNQADAFNAGPGQGARGAARDILGVSELISGDANAGAGILNAQGMQANQNAADRDAQQNAALTGLASIPADLIASYLQGR